jgi:protein HOOK3
MIQTLEEQVSSLVDKNAALEEEHRKVSAYKPLLDSYKVQIAELETRNSSRGIELDNLKFELEQAKVKLNVTLQERAKDQEALEAFQERVTELENAPVQQTNKASERSVSSTDDGIVSNEDTIQEESDGADKGLRAELNDALSGRTTADLKIEIRQLQRELVAVKSNHSDSSRVLVLENLLDDANRMKAKYESEYLAAHRDKLVLQRDLEDIRNGRTFGDG